MSLDAVVHAIVAEMRDVASSQQPLPDKKSSFDRPCTPRKPSPASSISSSTSSRQSSITSSSPRTPTSAQRRRRRPPTPSTPPSFRKVDDPEITIQKARALFNPPSCPSISSRSTSSTAHSSEMDSKELRIEVITVPIECLSPCVMQWSKPRHDSIKSGNGNGNNTTTLAKKIRKILNITSSRKMEESFDEKDEKWETGSVRRYRV